jgi:hypothetical protein
MGGVHGNVFLVLLERVVSGVSSTITLAVDAECPEDAAFLACKSLGAGWVVKAMW